MTFETYFKVQKRNSIRQKRTMMGGQNSSKSQWLGEGGWEERKKTFISCLDNISCGSGKFFRAVIYHEVSQIIGDIDLIETPFQYVLSQEGWRAWNCQFKALFNQH